jgi:hypothetical protein
MGGKMLYHLTDEYRSLTAYQRGTVQRAVMEAIGYARGIMDYAPSKLGYVDPIGFGDYVGTARVAHFLSGKSYSAIRDEFIEYRIMMAPVPDGWDKVTA